MRAISLFSGIGGGDLGLEAAGVDVVAQVEIDRFCNRVLERRWPDVARFGDVRTFSPAAVGPADVVVGGSPCQDLSVAGRRAGLAGERSGLFYDLVRILDESAAPWLLFENVPGLLSSHHGADFAIVLAELTGFEPEVPKGGWRSGGICVGPRRAVAWRVLDAQYFGLAQRRRRLFLVAHPRADRAAQVLFDAEGSAGDPAPRDEEAAIAAGALARSVVGVSGRDDVGANKGTLIVAPSVAAPLRAEGHDASEDGTGRQPAHLVEYIPDVAYSLRASESKQNGSPERGDVTLITQRVAHTLTASGGPSQPSSPSRMMDEDVNLVAVFRKATRPHGPDGEESWVGADVSNTLNTFDSGDVRATELVVAAIRAGLSRVRRLTITERERLQGFPDGWTCLCGATPYSSDSCRCPDGPRARALGNAMPVNVLEWIARRIVAVSRG